MHCGTLRGVLQKYKANITVINITNEKIRDSTTERLWNIMKTKIEEIAGNMKSAW